MREVPLCASDEQVNVIRGKHEREDLDPGESGSASQDTAEELVRPFGRTEEQTPLEAADCEKYGFRTRTFELVVPSASPLVDPRAAKHESSQRGARHLAMDISRWASFIELPVVKPAP